MRHNPALFLALPVLVPTAACFEDQVCTMAYVADQVEIIVETPDLAEGEWTVTVDTASCTLTVPGGVESCTEGEPSLVLLMSEDGRSLTQMRLWEGAPATVDIELVHEGVMVFADSIEPTYIEEEPNGEGCGVVQWATVSISFND